MFSKIKFGSCKYKLNVGLGRGCWTNLYQILNFHIWRRKNHLDKFFSNFIYLLFILLLDIKIGIVFKGKKSRNILAHFLGGQICLREWGHGTNKGTNVINLSPIFKVMFGYIYAYKMCYILGHKVYLWYNLIRYRFQA
jgi:hypothetical protein